jgi:sulfatase maturation enzyme AslB (radical SAM superfamily)
MQDRSSQKIEDCKKCDYGTLCKGGCPYLAYAGSGDILQKDYFCEGYKIFFRKIGEVMTKELIKMVK